MLPDNWPAYWKFFVGNFLRMAESICSTMIVHHRIFKDANLPRKKYNQDIEDGSETTIAPQISSQCVLIKKIRMKSLCMNLAVRSLNSASL